MTFSSRPGRTKRLSLAGAPLVAVAFAMIGTSVPSLGQDRVDDQRIRKIEAEVRALQRKVFPGGDQRFFEPEIKNAPAAEGTSANPATSPLSDVLTRMDALEAQIARLTGQVESNGNRITQIEAKLGMIQASETPAPMASATPATAATPAVAATASTPTPTPTPTPAPAPQANLDVMTGGASATAPKPAASPPSSRVDAVSAIVKPQTDDPGDDEYSYGFRLWDAKFYPEAQQQLKMFIDKYPRHSRTSWGRNLLGRAYLDAGDPREAAKWFLQNYQADKRGDRAPDSLLYLAVAMKRLDDKKRACIALAEFSETYAAEASGRLQGLYDATRNGLACP